MRSEKEPEEEQPKGVGMGVHGWVLNILVRWFLIFVLVFFLAVLKGMWDLSCPTGMERTPSIGSMESYSPD